MGLDRAVRCFEWSPAPDQGDQFCYVHSFIYTDMNASLKVGDRFSFYVNVRNLLNARARCR